MTVELNLGDVATLAEYFKGAVYGTNPVAANYGSPLQGCYMVSTLDLSATKSPRLVANFIADIINQHDLPPINLAPAEIFAPELVTAPKPIYRPTPRNFENGIMKFDSDAAERFEQLILSVLPKDIVQVLTELEQENYATSLKKAGNNEPDRLVNLLNEKGYRYGTYPASWVAAGMFFRTSATKGDVTELKVLLKEEGFYCQSYQEGSQSEKDGSRSKASIERGVESGRESGEPVLRVMFHNSNSIGNMMLDIAPARNLLEQRILARVELERPCAPLLFELANLTAQQQAPGSAVTGATQEKLEQGVSQSQALAQ